MATSCSKKYSAILYAALAILTAMALRQIGFRVDDPLDQITDSLRAGIYIGMFAFWGVSLRRRIVQPQVRRYFTVIPALMIVWITVRFIRFSFAEDPWVSRHLWYLYYLGMQFIPCLAVLVSLSLGKPENFRLSKWTKLLYIPTALFFLLVLTNDVHQLVFVFPEDAVVWANDYRYGPLYPFAIGWEICCALTALITMLVKCRVRGSRRVIMLPFVPVILAVVYAFLYIFCMPVLKPLAGDITVVLCLLFAAAFESCVQCGLIQSNTGYDELFMVSRLGAQITDRGNTVRLASLNARELTEEQRISAVTEDTAHSEYAEHINQVAAFLMATLAEREKLSTAICEAKSKLPLDMDSETGLNRIWQNLADTFRRMAVLRNSEVVIANGGSGYRFNGEGNQVSCRCDAKRVTTINFDRNKIRGMTTELGRKADEVSGRLDQYLVNTTVDYPPFEMNDSFDTILSDFIQQYE